MESENRAPSSSDVQESKHTESTVAALRLQKVYRSYRTRRRLADSAVVAEELWYVGGQYFSCTGWTLEMAKRLISKSAQDQSFSNNASYILDLYIPVHFAIVPFLIQPML